MQVETKRLLDLGDNTSRARRTAHEYVRDSIRLAILRGALAPGARLVQADVARELGVSTTPVREALRDLATEGLVDLDAHRGALVTRFDAEELLEIHGLAKLLEPEAMRLAAAVGDHECLERAGWLIEEMERETDVGRWAELNRRFHESLVGGVRNRRLLHVLKGLRDAQAPYIGLALRQTDYDLAGANDDHRALVAAIRAGDGERAAAIASEHADLAARTLRAANELFSAESGNGTR